MPGADHDEWQNYANLLSAAHAAHLPEIRSLFRRLPWDGVERVLDAPSGDGFFSELIAEQVDPRGEVVAVDIDEAALASLQRRIQRLSDTAPIISYLADVFALPFPDGHFDFIWCAQSLISLAAPKELPPGSGTKNALEELRRVTRPGGRIALLEQDALHYVLLPWPAELELAIQHAQRKGFARLYGRPEQLDVGRQLGRILADSGFQMEQRISLLADRQGKLESAERAFLKAYLEELRSRVHKDLSPDELREFDRLADPDSPDSFFRDRYFEMTWLEFVCLARNPEPRSSRGRR